MFEWYGWTWAAAMEAIKPVIVGGRAAEALWLLSLEMGSFLKDMHK